MNHSVPAPSKKALRRSLISQRLALSTADWQQRNDQICHHLHYWSDFVAARTVLAYFSIQGEPDLSSLFDLPKRWGFPRCVGTTLIWHHWSPGQPRQAGKFGILEPLPDAPTIEVSESDLILVPAVACDGRGYRLGYGGGFYDRLLSQTAISPTTVGIVFEFARVPQLPIEPWDRSLTAVCTEVGLFPAEPERPKSAPPS